MIDNRKEDYAHVINRYTKNIIEGLIPKRIVPFDYYEARDVDEDVKNWIERSDGEFAVVIGEAGFGKTNLLCNLANELLNEEHYAVFFVKSENLRGKDFDKKILEDLEITETGLNAFLRKIIDENEKVIFLLDTLDIIATDEGIARLDDFLTKIKGEKRVVIGASRPLEFKKIEHLTMKTFALKPFSDAEIQHLFEKYKAFYSMEGVELRLPVLEVCRNPLHMRMLFEVYQPNEIPEDINTQKLYDRYWDKKIAEIRIGALSHLDEGKKRKAEELKEELTKNIASEMLACKQITLRKSDIKDIKDEMREDYSKIQYAEVKNSTDVKIIQIIKKLIIEYDSIIDDAYHDLLDEGVLRAQDDSIEFFHQSFFEYAEARALIEDQSRRSLLKDLLSNITSLDNSGIIQQLILYAKRKKKDEIAYEFLKKLAKADLYTKILAIDLLKHIENVAEEDVKIYQSLTKDKGEVRKYLAKSLNVVIPKHQKLAIGLIKTFSKDEDGYVREAAANALPKLLEVNPELAIGLIKTFSSKDEHWYVRGAAANALPKLLEVNPELAIGLIKTFSSKDEVIHWYVQLGAAEALSKLTEVNPELATGLIETLSKDEDGYARLATAGALSKLLEVNPELAIGLIETLSKDEDEGVRGAAAEALSKLLGVNPELAIELIKTFSKDEDGGVRLAAAEVLSKLLEVNPELATGLIKTFSKDEDGDVRGTAAAEALPKLLEVNPELATGLIETLSKDEYGYVREAAAEALPKLLEVNPELATGLIETLSKDEDGGVRLGAAGALPKLLEVNPELAIGLIKTLSKDEDGYVRLGAAGALPKLLEVNPELAIGLIKTLSKDEDGYVRLGAAGALSKLLEVNSELATGLIETLSKDEDWYVRGAAAEALSKLLEVKPELAIGLIEALSKDEDGGVRGAAAEALSKLLGVNPELAIELIKTFSKDVHCYARKAAANALLELASLDPQKARTLVEKLKDVEYIEIQKTIAEIAQSGLLKRKE